MNIDFEPFKPINTSLYLCDNKFHTEALTALLADDNRFGFIVMDGNGALFGTLQVTAVHNILNSLKEKIYLTDLVLTTNSNALYFLFRVIQEMFSTSSLLTCPRSTAEEVSPLSVSLVSAWRRDTTT